MNSSKLLTAKSIAALAILYLMMNWKDVNITINQIIIVIKFPKQNKRQKIGWIKKGFQSRYNICKVKNSKTKKLISGLYMVMNSNSFRWSLGTYWRISFMSVLWTISSVGDQCKATERKHYYQKGEGGGARAQNPG